MFKCVTAGWVLGLWLGDKNGVLASGVDIIVYIIYDNRDSQWEDLPLAATYSEQKNCPTRGQISLVRQIAAQITKVNLWKINITKPDILFFVMPNNKHLASFVDFIMTLRWDPFDGTIFLHTIKLALHIHIT